MMKNHINNGWIALLLSTLILCFWAFFNLFPLTFNSDTAVYLETAFSGRVREDRPILYGLFMKVISFETSLWLVVIVQSLLISFVILLNFNIMAKQSYSLAYHMLFILLITFGMGASFVSCWLMPDIFTPITILCLGFLLFNTNSRKLLVIAICILFVVSIAMHNSHFYICTAILLILLFGFIIKPIRILFKKEGFYLKRLCYIFTLVVLSNFLSSMLHQVHNGNLKNVQSGVFFLMGNFVEMGVLDSYLADNCAQKNFKICQYKDSIPNNFLWSEKSPLNKEGGWIYHKVEYTFIVKDILTTPKYLIQIVYKSILLTLKQFFMFDTGEAKEPTQRVDDAIINFYPDSYEHFNGSRQTLGKLDFQMVNFFQTLIFGICLLIYTLVFLLRKMNTRYRLYMAFILLSLFINAFICGTLSGVFPRYQDRLVWLLPLPLFAYIMEYVDVKKQIQKLKNAIWNSQF